MNESKSDASVSVDEGPPSTDASFSIGEAPLSSEIPSSGGPVPISRIPESLRIGTIVDGRWRLLRVIGVGGTATVYEAEDVSSAGGAHVAVKALHRDCASNEAIRSRFLREAYLANKVQHPAVVAVLGDGVVGKIPFIVMELLEGETLDARWERKGRRLEVTEVLWAVDKLLDVLVAAHAKGIVHRDIKPENLFLTSDRQLKVLDFGLARLFEGVGYDASRTQIGFVMGTPAFMPPEQAKGRWDQVGVQTDLWSVGATMFCLLSGRLVHEGEQILEVVEAATTQAAPSLGKVAPGLPSSVVDVVDFALAFEMDRRWPNARIMKLAVRKAYVALTAPEDETPNSEQESAAQLQRGTLVDALGLPSPPVSMRSPSLPKLRADLDSIPAPHEAGLPSEAAPSSKSPSAVTLPSAMGLEEMSRSSGKLPVAEVAGGKLAAEASRPSGKLVVEDARSGERSLPDLAAERRAVTSPDHTKRPSSKDRIPRDGSLPDARSSLGSDGRSQLESASRAPRQASRAMASAQPSIWAWLAAGATVAAFLVVVYLVLRRH